MEVMGKLPPPECGDGNCNADETYQTCPDDCEYFSVDPSEGIHLDIILDH